MTRFVVVGAEGFPVEQILAVGLWRCSLVMGELDAHVAEALAADRRAKPHHRGFAHARLRREFRQRHVDHLDRAVEHLRGIVAEEPGESNPASLLAIALAARGDHEEAVALAEKALELYPAERDMWIRGAREWDLARVLLLCGRTEEAEALLREICTSPGSAISREFLRAAPLYQEHSPIAQFAVVADFEL